MNKEPDEEAYGVGASWQRTAKPMSTKHTGGKSGGCASKAVELTSGDPRHVTESRLRVERSILTV